MSEVSLREEPNLKRWTPFERTTKKMTFRDVQFPVVNRLFRRSMSSHMPRPIVLLVEDSEDDAFFFRWTLHKCGFECDVVYAADGSAAIQHLENCLSGNGSQRPDLVFLDLKIPAFNGFEVLSWIRDQRFDPPLDVAVLSGSEHASDIQRAHALGSSAYYVKPLSVEQLRGRFAGWYARQGAEEIPAWAAPGGVDLTSDASQRPPHSKLYQIVDCPEGRFPKRPALAESAVGKPPLLRRASFPMGRGRRNLIRPLCSHVPLHA